LQEKSVIQDETSKNYGKEVFKELGYYVTIEGCLNGLMKTKLREFIGKKEENDIVDLIEEEHKLQDFIKSLNIKN